MPLQYYDRAAAEPCHWVACDDDCEGYFYDPELEAFYACDACGRFAFPYPHDCTRHVSDDDSAQLYALIAAARQVWVELDDYDRVHAEDRDRLGKALDSYKDILI